MKTLALHRAEVFPQLLEFLPRSLARPSNQSRQQNHREGEAVQSQFDIHGVTSWRPQVDSHSPPPGADVGRHNS